VASRAGRHIVNRVYWSAQEAMGEDWPESNQGINKSLIGFLLDRGYPEGDIVGCAGYVGQERYVGVTDMRRVRNVIAGWIRSGRPKVPAKPGEVVRLGKPEDYRHLGQKVDQWTERLRKRRRGKRDETE